jgi:hypothetical protein
VTRTERTDHATITGGTIWLHIGAPKTGSSALQSALAINRQALLEQGVHYPPSKTDSAAVRGEVTSGNGGPLASFIRTAAPDETMRQKVWQFLNSALAAQTPASQILYSSELMAAASLRPLEQLAEFAQAAGRQIRIVFYVRHLVDHAMSKYNATMAGGERIDLRTYLSNYQSSLMQLSPYERVFGISNIHVKIYDEEKSDLLGGFVPLLGISSQALERAPVVNRGPTPSELEALRQAWAEFEIEGNPRKQASFRQIARRIAGESRKQLNPVIVEPAELAEVQERNSAVLDHFNRTYFGGMKRLKVASEQITIGTRPEYTAVDRNMLKRLRSELTLAMEKSQGLFNL